LKSERGCFKAHGPHRERRALGLWPENVLLLYTPTRKQQVDFLENAVQWDYGHTPSGARLKALPSFIFSEKQNFRNVVLQDETIANEPRTGDLNLIQDTNPAP